MNDTTQRLLSPDSSLVVVYLKADPYFHERDADRPNRPRCQPDLQPGVLTPLLRAQDSGLMPCPQCWLAEGVG